MRTAGKAGVFAFASALIALALGSAALVLAAGTPSAYADDLITNVTICGETVIGPGQQAEGISVSDDGTIVTFDNVDIAMPDDAAANDVVKIESSIPDLTVALVGDSAIYSDKQGARGVHLLAYCEDGEIIPQHSIVGPGSLAVDVVGHGIFAGNYAGPYFNLTVTDGAYLDIECLLNGEPTPDVAFAGNAIQVAYGGFFVSNGARIDAVSDAVDTINIGSADDSVEPLLWLRLESGAELNLENRFDCKIEDGLGTVETACLFYLGERAVIDDATLNMSSPTKMAYTTNGLMTLYATMAIQNGATVTYRTPEWQGYHGQSVDVTAVHGIIAPRLTIDGSTIDVNIDLSDEPDRIKAAYAVGIAYAWYLNIVNGAQVNLDLAADSCCGIHWKGNTKAFTNGDITIDASRVDVNTAQLAQWLPDRETMFGVFGHTLTLNTAEEGQGLFIEGTVANEDFQFIALALYWKESAEQLPFDPAYVPEAVALGDGTAITVPENGLCSRYSVKWYDNETAFAGVYSVATNRAEDEVLLVEGKADRIATLDGFIDRTHALGRDKLSATDKYDEHILQANGAQWGIIDTVFAADDTSVPVAECAITHAVAPKPVPAPDNGDVAPATGDAAGMLAGALLAVAGAACAVAAGRRRVMK